MKKNLLTLTGIALLIAILAAGACNRGAKNDSSTGEEPTEKDLTQEPKKPPADSIVKIYLKEREIYGVMHLEMSDSRKPDCPVIDNLETLVYPEDTVIFYPAQHSKVDEVVEVSVVEPEDMGTFSVGERRDSGLFVLIINPESPDTTKLVKYNIVFKVKHDETEYPIDPYLKIPPGVQ